VAAEYGSAALDGWHGVCHLGGAKGEPSPMSAVQTLASNLTLRWMIQRDLPYLLQIEQQSHALRWTQQDFLSVFQSIDTAGCVAEVGDRVVGYLNYWVPASQGGDDGPESTPSAPERGQRKKKSPAP